MSKAMLNIYARTFKRRMDAGETFDEVRASFPRLTDVQVKEVMDAMNKNREQ